MNQFRSVAVPGADVRLTAEGADRHRVLVEDQQVVAEAAVHVAHAAEARRQDARKERNEAAAQQSLSRPNRHRSIALATTSTGPDQFDGSLPTIQRNQLDLVSRVVHQTETDQDQESRV